MESSEPRQVDTSGTGAIGVGGNVSHSHLTTYVTHVGGAANAPAFTPTRHVSIPFLPLGEKFTGRREILKDLAGELIAGHASVLSQPSALHADGGVGKTTLAVELGWQLYDEKRFDYVFFLNATSPENLESSLAELCDPGSPGAPPPTLAQRRDAVLHWLQDRSRTVQVLLIFDNADSTDARRGVRDLLPKLPHCARLITSRYTVWPNMSACELQLFTPAEAIEFLRSRLGPVYCDRLGTEADLGAIAEAVDHLPLALEIVASYLLKTRQSPADWLVEWSQLPEITLEHQDEDRVQYPRALVRVWEQSFAGLSVKAKEWLSIFTWLAPRPADFDLTSLRTAPEWRDTRSALGELADASLLSWRQGTDEVSIHRILQAVSRHRMSDEERNASQQSALALVGGVLPEAGWDKTGWLQWEKLSPHLGKILEQMNDEQAGQLGSSILNKHGQWLDNRSQYAEAEPLYRRALAIDEKSLGPDHPNVAIRLNNLAVLLKATNRLAEAEPLYRRALAISEKNLGSEHPSVAIRLNNLAVLLKATNRLAEAEPLYRRALAISEESLGSEHPSVAIRLNNLAVLLQETNRLAEAEPLLCRALVISEKSLGPDHPDVAIRLNNMAMLLKDTNRLVEAEPLFRRALAIDEKSLGPNHPDVATNLSNLAVLLQETNHLTEAEPLLRRALNLTEKSLGPDHPNVATRLSNLAMLLQETNRSTEAEPLCRRALAIDEKSLGPNHPKVATRLNNLAVLMQETNRLAEAEPFLRRALSISEKSLGPEHPNVAIRLNNLAVLMQETNRLAEAEPLLRRAVEFLSAFQRGTGYEHPHFHTALQNYVAALKALHLREQEIELRVNNATGTGSPVL